MAGPLGVELHYMADSALDEVARYASGLAFTDPVTPQDLARMA